MSTFINPNPAEEQTPASEFIDFPDELKQSQERDPWEVVDEIDRQEVDARADALVDAQIAAWKADAAESEEEGDGEYDDPVLLSERTPKESYIKIVLFQPDQCPRVVTIENTLSSLQETVGGLIEVFPVGVAGAIGVCNEEFLGLGLPLNRFIRVSGTVICGPFFVVGEGVHFRSLTDRQIVDVLLKL